MTISDIDLREILSVEKETRSGQYICRCPFCGKESHLYINKRTQAFDCKKCGESGNIYKLLRFLGKTYLLDGATVVEHETINSIRSIIDEDKKEIKLEKLPVVKMPIGYKVLHNSNKYLISRGINKDLCERYRFGVTNLISKYKDYILIPIFDDGKIRGYIGRYGNKVVPKYKLRYNNSIGTEFAQLLFGYDEITSHTISVIIVEGVFDKIAVDKALDLFNNDEIKCVCTFGKKISEYQIQKLKIKGVIKVILLYDYDALKDVRRIGLELQKDFITDITYTTKKDIDECTRDEAIMVFSRTYKPIEFNLDVLPKLR